MTNSGLTSSGSVTGTLLASGGVTSPSGAQSYGVIAPSATACRTFTFVVSASCGATVTTSLQAAESGGATKTFAYPPFQVGAIASSFSQNFDAVVAPALPAGWTTSTLGGAANLWATNTTSPDTAPNRAFAADPSTVSDNVLVSPLIAVPAGANRLSFRHNYITESTFDGGVLELSIGGGAFQDIITAGGSFVGGGYNATISTAFGSPIAGRQAWSGTSAGGYITTVVNLPLSAGGQNVQLRWRMASDNSVSSTGWAVDTISIGDFVCTAITGATAVNDSYSTAFNTPLSVPAPGVLGNDTGTTPLTTSLGTNASHGVVALSANGSFTYTPNAGYTGGDAFTYRANNAGGPSNLATVSIAVNAPTTVQPALRISSMAGSVVTFRWTPPAIGPAPTGYVLEAGVTPGGLVVSLPLGAVPSFTVSAPTGTFYVRVRAVDGGGSSGVSNEIPLYMNVPVPPSAPGNLLGTVAGSALTLAWTNTFGGGAPTGLVLDVSGTVSASLPLGLSDTFSFPAVPGGTYTFSLRATNAVGSSTSSNAVTLTFPGGCSGVPLPPSNFLAFSSGSTLFLDWETATSGPAPSSFVLDVTSGVFTGALPLGGRSLSVAVPSGSYTLRVQAVNACGGSTFTAPQTVVVP